jgi:galactokinase
MQASGAEIHSALISRVTARFRERFGAAPEVVAVAPGRANIIGEHTDYNGGFVLPFAVDRAVAVALARTPGRGFALESLDFSDELTGDLPASQAPLPIRRDWAGYVAGILNELAVGGHALEGFRGVVAGEVPIGSGLSSSAAFEVAVVSALDLAFGLGLPPWDKVRLCQATENHWFGVRSGLMDQFASVFGQPGAALFLDNTTLAWRAIPLQVPDLEWLVLDSGVPRTLAASGYNTRRGECERAVGLLNQVRHPIRLLSEIRPDQLGAALGLLPDVESRRARHVVEENARVLAAVGALVVGDACWLGSLLDESHRSLRDAYEVSLPELDFLAETARALEGVVGVRLMGAGFGGSMIVAARAGAVERVIPALVEPYRQRFGRVVGGFRVAPSRGAYTLRP